MQLQPFLIEEYFRTYDFHTEITLCSSGVQPYSLGEVRARLGLGQEELDAVLLRDGYSQGDPGLRQAIARRFGDGDPDKVVCTHGSSEALFLALTSLLRAGDEVISLHPTYQSHYSLAEDLGCTVRYWRLRWEDGFAPDVGALKGLVSPRTRAVVVNFPNNPTGATLTAAGLRALVDVVADANAYLIWDDAFGALVYEGEPLPDPGTWYPRTVSVRTLSKAYGLPGLRVGWCQTALPEVIRQCVRGRDYISLNLSPLIELIARRAIERLDLLSGPRHAQARANRQTLAAWIARQAGRVAWAAPQGGVSAFLHLRGMDCKAFCHRLATERGVFLLPGDSFGYPEHVRLGFGGPTAELDLGLARLGEMLRDSGPS
jgi:capreomycidine synthase